MLAMRAVKKRGLVRRARLPHTKQVPFQGRSEGRYHLAQKWDTHSFGQVQEMYDNEFLTNDFTLR